MCGGGSGFGGDAEIIEFKACEDFELSFLTDAGGSGESRQEQCHGDSQHQCGDEQFNIQKATLDGYRSGLLAGYVCPEHGCVFGYS